MKHYKTMSVLALPTLLLLLTGCASTQTIYKTNTIYRNPPAFLLADCPVPDYKGTDWQDVAEYAKEVQVMLDLCNGDKGMLREWVADHE